MDSIKRQARIAGLLYLLACFPAPFVLIYVPGALIVPGDAVATASRVRASEALLRVAIGGELLNAILLIVAVLALYHLFKGVSARLALAMATLILVSIPISLLNLVNDTAALVVAKGVDFLAPFSQSQRDALTYLFLHLHGQGLVVAQIFWGLWLFPFGMLVVRSKFIPPTLGVLLMIAGTGYLASSFASLFLPQHVRVVSQIATILELGELPVLFYLLIWGAKVKPSDASTFTSKAQAG